MANRYRYATKKKLGILTKTDDTVYANTIEEAVFKMLDCIDPMWVDKNRKELEEIVKSQVKEETYTVFVCEYNEKHKIEGFIEQIDGVRIMN